MLGSCAPPAIIGSLFTKKIATKRFSKHLEDRAVVLRSPLSALTQLLPEVIELRKLVH